MHALYTIDGQKVAKRLSSQINKESIKLKSLLISYNETTMQQIDLSSVTNLSSEFWNDQETTTFRHATEPPTKVKLHMIHNWQVMKKSEEEKMLLQDDMLNFLFYFQNKIEIIKKCTARLNRENDILAGVYSLAQTKLAAIKLLLLQGVYTFSKLITIPEELHPENVEALFENSHMVCTDLDDMDMLSDDSFCSDDTDTASVDENDEDY